AYKTVTVQSSSISGGTISSNQAICAGETPAALTVAGYTGYITGWEKKIPSESTWTSVGYSSNPLPASYISNNTTYQYRMKVANNCGGQPTSTVATVTVNNVPTPPAPSATQNACGPQILHMDTGDLPTGVNWFWQGTNQTGESTQYNAANE